MKKNTKLKGILQKSLMGDEDRMIGKFRIEIFERSSIYIYGCRRILEYSPCRVVISLCGDALEICGEGLMPSFFHNGAISLTGNIRNVKFLREEEDGK